MKKTADACRTKASCWRDNLASLALFGILLATSPCSSNADQETVSNAARAEEKAVWLDELDLDGMKQGFGHPGRRQSVEGKVLTVAGHAYGRGVGTHAPSSLTLDLKGRATHFQARVGIDDEKKSQPGSVEFLLMGDGKILGRSGLMTGGQEPRLLEVDLKAVKQLELRVADGGDGNNSDHADWLQARIYAVDALDDLYPPGRRSAAWSRLSEEQVQRGYQLEPVAPGVWRMRLGQPEKFTPMTFQEVAARRKEMAALACDERLPIPPAGIGFRTSGRGCALEIPLESDERLYGLGMNLRVFQLNGSKKTVRVSDDQGKNLGDSHAPVPFYVSTRGYGIYVDTARYANFYFGNLNSVEESGSTAVFAKDDNQILSTEQLYAPRSTGAKSVGIDVPVARGVDLYLFSGPGMRQAVQRYNLFSGGGCLPPMWALGVWYRASTELGQSEVLAFPKEFRQRQIPCDVFGLEPGWQSHAYPCSFVWSARYSSPETLLEETRQQGYKLNLWEHAFTHPTAPIYQALRPWSGNYKVFGGLVPDFATAEARKIFADHHEKNLVAKGVAGFKLDECDHQPLSATPWSFPEHTAFPSGLDGEQMHLLLGPLYQRTIAGIYQARNQRTFGLVRASGALAAPLPFGVYSDAYDHRDYVRAIVTSGFGGILWTPEVRDMGSQEELYRRLETSVFSAVMQINCWYMKNPPWKQMSADANNKGQFMANWEQCESACRKILQMRMRLLPYLYAAFGQYHETGLPPARALVLDYPDDANTWAVDDQYLLGPSLMVAPLFAGQSRRSVYLPQGAWYDFWNGKRYVGGHKIEISKPAEELPVFVKEDSLLPLAEPVDCVQPSTEFALTVNVYGKRPAPLTLYEDDGTTLDFERGQQNRIELCWEEQGGRVRRSGQYAGPARYRIIEWRKVDEQPAR